MVKIVTVTLIAVVFSAFLPLAPASAADVCFQDQFGRRYGVWISGVFGPAVELFVTLSTTTVTGPGANTAFLTGGGYIAGNGKAALHLRTVGFGQTFTLDPPSFNSGVGTQWINDNPNTALTITPAACLATLP